MSCCSSRKTSVDTIRDTTSSRSEPLLRGSVHGDREDDRIGPVGEKFPLWVKDEDANNCYSCCNKFNSIMDRKHHCRRCRNIFCNSCTADKAKILMFGINEEVRVCRDCFRELPAENNFVSRHLPVLLAGANFKKFIMMGLSTKVVRLRLMANETTLVYDDDSKAESTEIPLNEVLKLTMTSLKAFEIVTPGKSFCFEADSASTQNAWMAALDVAITRAKEPPFRQKVDNNRRLRNEQLRREEGMAARMAQKNRESEARRGESSNIKYKYGMGG